MIRTVRALTVLGFAVGLILADAPAQASNAKAELIIAIEKTENALSQTRWNFNNQKERAALEADLVILNRMIDRVVQYEGDTNGFPCAGATMNPNGGPPRSTASSDFFGQLAQRRAQRAARALPSAGGDTRPVPGRARRFRGGGFLRRINDVEVELIVRIVLVEDELKTTRWNLSTAKKQEALQPQLLGLQQTLRRVRNGNC